MCGILGHWQFAADPVNIEEFQVALDLMRHRGPNDEGIVLIDPKTRQATPISGPDTPPQYVNGAFAYSPRDDPAERRGAVPVALGSRRLSILDLSEAGHMPMCDREGGLWIVYNGEVYNYRELRSELEQLGYTFHSNGDTEVVLNAFRAWGRSCVERFNGMWAFAIFDLDRAEVFMARDHLGIKPLYYTLSEDRLLFASEIKPLLRMGHPARMNERLAHSFLLTGGLDETNDTFFEGIAKLPAGHWMIVREGGTTEMHSYWRPQLATNPRDASPEDMKTQFRREFARSIMLRLRSDVPIGSCLSGGLDSSAIVMQTHHMREAHGRLCTFSACYPGEVIDERRYVDIVVDAAGAEAHYVLPTGEGFVSELDLLLWHQEEPFGGPGIYAQWCVMRAARERDVTVLLDGQGADEQLGGYRKYYLAHIRALWGRGHRLRAAVEALRYFGAPSVARTTAFRQGLRYFGPGRRLLQVEAFLDPTFHSRFAHEAKPWGASDPPNQLMLRDLTTTSLPALLRYEDKNSMAHSVEARLPFLDQSFVNFLSAVPPERKMYKGWSKWILRSAFSEMLPSPIAKRKSKQGFTTPDTRWLQHGLAEEMRNCFRNPTALGGLIHPGNVARRFERFLKGRDVASFEVFFRFFILDRWARMFILSSVEPAGDLAASSGESAIRRASKRMEKGVVRDVER